MGVKSQPQARLLSIPTPVNTLTGEVRACACADRRWGRISHLPTRMETLPSSRGLYRTETGLCYNPRNHDKVPSVKGQSMPLESLLELVETLQKRIDEHGAALRQSEALTRAALIDPLLRELGWDTANPALVIPEYSLGKGKADYALLKDGKPAIVVEAKKLDTSLGDAASQGIGYCIEDGIAYFAVTDGRQWQIYETHKMAPITEKLTVQFDIAQSPPLTCLKAMALWRPSVAAGSVNAAQAPVVQPRPEEQQAEHPEPVPVYSPAAAEQPAQPRISERQSASESMAMLRSQKEQSNASQAVPVSTNGGHDEEWIPLPNLNVRRGDTAPIEIEFPDGSRTQTGRWNRVLVESIRWLANSNFINGNHYPIRYGSRYILSDSPIHPNGSEFKYSIFVGPFAIETNYSAPDCVRNAIIITRRTGQNPAQFKVRFADEHASPRVPAPASSTLGSTNYDGTDWTPMSDLDIRRGDRRSSPAEIQFPDNKRVQARRWSHVMREVIRWLVDNDYLDQSHCPIQYASRYIIADSPSHPTGKGFTQAISIGEFYVEMNYQPPDCIRNAIIITQRAGQDPTQFKVRLSP